MSEANITNPNYESLLNTTPLGNDIVFMLSSINRRFIFHPTDYDYADTQGLEKIVNIGYDSTLGTQPTNNPSYYGVVDSDLIGTITTSMLISYIEDKYNLSFTGAITAPYIADYRLLLNSASRENNITAMNEYEVTNLGTAGNTIDIEAPYFDGVVNADGEPINYGSSAFPIAVYNDSTNSFRVNEVFEDERFFRMGGVGLSTLSSTGFVSTSRFVSLKQYQLRVCVQTTVTNFEVDVLRDGEVIETITESNPQESTTFNFNKGTDTRISAEDEKGGEADWSFKVRAQGNGTINIHYRIAQNIVSDLFFGDNDFNHMGTKVTSYTTKSISVTSAGNDYYDVSANLPKMKIKDFLGVLMKQFNLIPTVSVDDSGLTTIDFKHYDYYINQGNLYDINDYVDISREEVTPSNFYSGIEFKHNDPKSGMEQAFFKVNNRNYGALDYTFAENDMQIQGSMFEMKINTHRIPIEALEDLSGTTVFRKTLLTIN